MKIEISIPQVAGEMDFKLTGKSKDNTPLSEERIRVQVKTDGFVSLRDLEIDFDTSETKGHSHSEGVYGTVDTKTKLRNLLNEYRTQVREQILVLDPILESEAASLPWGGVYDVNHDWLDPHCGHRDGKTLDLSLSVFNLYDNDTKKMLLEVLEDVIRNSDFDFSYSKRISCSKN